MLTSDSAPADRRAALEEVAEVVSCGATGVEPSRLVDVLVARGLLQMHCEGGPSLLGSLIQADALDALALTVSPNLEGGQGTRITHPSGDAAPLDLRALALTTSSTPTGCCCCTTRAGGSGGGGACTHVATLRRRQPVGCPAGPPTR